MTALMRIARFGKVVPWGNGLGSSREVEAEFEHGLAAVAGPVLSWRLATTTIANSCPFSHYLGYDRTIILLHGNGFELNWGQREAKTIDRFGQMIDFPGDPATICRLLDGPVDVLNVMAMRSRIAYAVKFETLDRNSIVELTGPALKVIYCVGGELRVRTKGTSTLSVRAGEALRINVGQPTPFSITSGALYSALAVLEIFSSV